MFYIQIIKFGSSFLVIKPLLILARCEHFIPCFFHYLSIKFITSKAILERKEMKIR